MDECPGGHTHKKQNLGANEQNTKGNWNTRWTMELLYWGGKVVKNMEKQICDHINSKPIMQYWRTKGTIIEKQTPVDWEAMERAIGESIPKQKWWAGQFTTGFFAHWRSMNWWKLQMATECPWCQASNKDKSHIIWCLHPTVGMQWEKLLASLEN